MASGGEPPNDTRLPRRTCHRDASLDEGWPPSRLPGAGGSRYWEDLFIDIPALIAVPSAMKCSLDGGNPPTDIGHPAACLPSRQLHR